MCCKANSIAKSNCVEDYSLWSKLLKGLQQNSLERNSVLKPQCWDYSTSKTIEILASQWVPWLWVLNNLAAVFSFSFIQCTIIENGLMTCSGVLCSIFSSLHYVCPVGAVLTALGVSKGSVGRGPGTSTIKLDERLAQGKGACRDRVFHCPRCMDAAEVSPSSFEEIGPFIQHGITRIARVVGRSDRIYCMCHQG